MWSTGRDAEKGARAVEQIRAAGAPAAEFLAADFTSFAQIRTFITTLKPKLRGTLNALVHSSGVLNSERRVSPDGLEETWASQFVGRYLVTEALRPALEATTDSRIVFVGAPLFAKNTLKEDDLTLEKSYGVFASTQHAYLACQIYMERYAKAHPTGPFINGGHAGLVSTGIGRGVTGPMRLLISVMTMLQGISAERSAKNFVALASGPELSGVTGFFFPKPEKLSVRQAIQHPTDQHAAFERIVTHYAALRDEL